MFLRLNERITIYSKTRCNNFFQSWGGINRYSFDNNRLISSKLERKECAVNFRTSRVILNMSYTMQCLQSTSLKVNAKVELKKERSHIEFVLIFVSIPCTISTFWNPLTSQVRGSRSKYCICKLNLIFSETDFCDNMHLFALFTDKNINSILCSL